MKAALEVMDAWNRGDREAWLDAAHPEVEWSSAVQRQVEGDDTICRGRVELARFWDEWHGVWDLTIDVVETRDLGDVVVLLADMHTKGVASGAEIARRIGYVVEFDHGLFRRARAYLSAAEALEAVGLRE